MEPNRANFANLLVTKVLSDINSLCFFTICLKYTMKMLKIQKSCMLQNVNQNDQFGIVFFSFKF